MAKQKEIVAITISVTEDDVGCIDWEMQIGGDKYSSRAATYTPGYMPRDKMVGLMQKVVSDCMVIKDSFELSEHFRDFAVTKKVA